METILITGGTGLVGRALTFILQQRGFEVTYLSRQKAEEPIKSYYWNVITNEIDSNAVTGADYIIHLAGANVAAHRWTTKYKNTIRDSRVRSSALLYKALEQNQNRVKAIVSASAIGYYGDKGDVWLDENTAPAPDFLGSTCMAWEDSVSKMTALHKRVAILRTGIVLSGEGGALPPLIKPLRFGIAPIFGSGSQYYPWIHIHDLCMMYVYAITDASISGAYNATAPEPERFSNFMRLLADSMGKSKINIPVPGIALRLLLGEFADTLAMSTRCSSAKISATGFAFKFAQLKDAFRDLVK